METLFWISAFIIFYTFIGYGLIITLLARSKKRHTPPALTDTDLPHVTLLVAAYNEADILCAKVSNCLQLNYPADKVHLVFVTDGSDDGSEQLLSEYPGIKVFHQAKRAGKIAAVNRVMPSVTTDITIFTDANVMINTDGLRKMAGHFQRNLVGAVSGEKVVLSAAKDAASASGEGFYWKYESFLKKQDAQWNSLVGAAGELFAIRTHLYESIDSTVLIEDFVLTMGIAARGYKVAYEPTAIAEETASANIAEETKRKVRIAAGGIQAVIRLLPLLNLLKYGKLSFQYISHRVLRWTLMPPAMVLALLTNAMLSQGHALYRLLFVAQLAFYGLAMLGHFWQHKHIRIKGFFAPYYFVFMHICVVRGWFRYFSGNQQVTWEKAQRIVLKS